MSAHVAERLEPATDRCVIRAPDGAAHLAAALASLGTVEQLVTTEPLHVLTLATPQPAADAWAAVQKALGGKHAAYPVLIDSDGAPHYPTGDITVRFEQTPSAGDVKAFGDAHGLKLARANELAPKQFVYAPVAPAAEFLPDLVARLASQPGVRSAWANTLSVYRRGAS
jgi:hypothetical protein